VAIGFTLNSVAYGAHGSGNARVALDFASGAGDYETVVHHVPGVDGSYKTRCGRRGRTMVATVRYVGTLANVQAYAAADREAMANVAVTIVDVEGTSRTNCELTAWRWVRTPVGGGSTVIGDVELTFRCDA
jgi:hypothetical protein